MLTDKTIYRDQSFANGIYGDEKTFEGDGTKQRRSIGGNEAWRGDFIAVESQPCFGDGPCVSLSSSDDHSLRTRGFQFELFRQRLRYDAQSRAGIDKELNFFDMPRRPGQMSLYVKKSHLNYFFKNKDIVSPSIGNAIVRNEVQEYAKLAMVQVDTISKFSFVINCKTAKRIGPTVPPNVLVRADRVIR